MRKLTALLVFGCVFFLTWQSTSDASVIITRQTSPYDKSTKGDFNIDSIVDARDLALWKGVFGTNYFATENRLRYADANGDLAFEGADFLIWQRNFGRTGFPVVYAEPAASAVPEPSSGLLATIVAACSVLARQRVACRANRLR